MTEKYSVSRLEEISFTACLKDILGNLLLCPEHRPESSRHLNSYSSLISIHPNLFSSSNVRSFVRNRLNQHLIGIMNDEIRKKLVCEFNHNFEDDSDQISDIWVFLDCVLDTSFTELYTHVAFPRSEPNEKIVQIIGHRSPNIKTLELDFEMVMEQTSLEKLKPIVTSLSGLVHLTSLSLHCLSKHHRNILNCIGYSCPKLKHFSVTGFQIVNQDILALVLGDALNLFPEKQVMLEEETDIHKFEIAPEYLAPFCSTLQHLELEYIDEKDKLQELRKSREYRGVASSAFAFAIRHMKNLRRIDHSSSLVISSVQLLIQNSKEIYEEMDNVNGPLRLPHSIPTNVPFSGIVYFVHDLYYAVLCLTSRILISILGVFSLTNLDFVNISSAVMMKAVGRMCPFLKEVTFSEMLHTDEMTKPDQLFEILTAEWPKVIYLSLHNE